MIMHATAAAETAKCRDDPNMVIEQQQRRRWWSHSLNAPQMTFLLQQHIYVAFVKSLEYSRPGGGSAAAAAAAAAASDYYVKICKVCARTRVSARGSENSPTQ